MSLAPTITSDAPDTDAAALRAAKVAALQQRRAAEGATADPSPAAAAGHGPGRRKQVAQGSKIAATALGVTAMFAMVGAMGAAAKQPTTAAAAAPAPAAPAQVVVVIHPAGGGATTTAGAVPASPSQPIALSAQPTVRQAPASQAPAAKTNGSK